MSITQSYQGSLLVANPNNPKDSLHQSVILLLVHTKSTAIGVQINRPVKSLTMKSLAKNQGLSLKSDQPIWYGGNVDSSKIHVVHSSDWSCDTTMKVNDAISVTNDSAILTAISQDQGPTHYRACAGYWLWEKSLLDLQLTYPQDDDIRHDWETLPATIDAVFEDSVIDQWLNNLEDCARHKINTWFPN